MSDADFDLCVIGAGIQGAGVAQAAAAAGHTVMLLEQSGIASGTSSRSSKLIHGGLRYLESGQLRLVRECLRERHILLQIAPQLVHLTPHFLPVYRSTRRRPWLLRAGLSLYALLGGLGRDVRFSQVPRGIWSELDGIRQDGLQAVFRYFDAQTDDATLTRAVVRSAQRLGAVLEMPATFLGAAMDEPLLRVQYRSSAGDMSVRCRALVNAAGPWVNEVLLAIAPRTDALPVELVAGTHVILQRRLTRGVYYTEAPADGRAVFIMPWGEDQTLVGTTERSYRGDPAQVEPTSTEIDYLLETVRHYFPAYASLAPVGAFAGLRVLPAAQSNAFSRSRDTRLHCTHGGRVLSIFGGKLTAYRANAERVMALLRTVLPERIARADTATLKLLEPDD